MKPLRHLAGIGIAGGLLAAPPACAQPPRAALFAFELDDTSLQGEIQGPAPEDLARLARLDAQLQEALVRSGRYEPVAVAADPLGPTLRTCGGCEVDAARKLAAQVSVIGWVQKVSTLILNINIVMRDVATGGRVAGGSVDIRGDTDESWTRGLSFLLRNRILVGATAQ
jgi:hypothetical protein